MLPILAASQNLKNWTFDTIKVRKIKPLADNIYIADKIILPTSKTFTASVADTLFEITTPINDAGSLEVIFGIKSIRTDSSSTMGGRVQIDYARVATGIPTVDFKYFYGSAFDNPAGITDMTITFAAATTTVGKLVIHATVVPGIIIPATNKIYYEILNHSSNTITIR